MAYVREPSEISPGDVLVLTYWGGENVEIDLIRSDDRFYEKWDAEAVIIVEVKKVVIITTKGKEE